MNELLNFTSLDFFLAAVILLSVIVSLFRGFFSEVVSLLTWFIAFYAALKFSPSVMGLYHSFVVNAHLRFVLAAVTIFILVMILGAIFNKLIHMLVNGASFGFIDKFLGFILGVVRGILFAVITLFIVKASPMKDTVWAKNSVLSPHFQGLVIYFNNLLPKEAKHLKVYLHQLPTASQ